MSNQIDKKRRYLWVISISLILVFLLIFVFITPSNNRVWAKDQSVLPYAEFLEDSVKVYNIRNNSYRTVVDFDASYYNESFDLDSIYSVSLLVMPFGDWEGMAHTFLSFGFTDNFVSVSIEARRELGESYSATKGVFRNYELIYTVASEEDIIKLRSAIYGFSLYLYPLNLTRNQMKEIFLHIMIRVNKIKEHPEFYNTLSNSCNTNIFTHLNSVLDKNLPLGLEVIAPGYTDKLLYDHHLIITDKSFNQTKTASQIDEKVKQYYNSPEFSLGIRK